MRNKLFTRWVIVLFISILVGLFFYTQIEISRIENKYPPEGQFVSTANGEVDIHYISKGKGTPIVMLHGRDGTLQEFTLSIFDTVAENYQAIALDRPGYGYSKCTDPAKLTTEKQAQLINEALKKLNIKKPLLIGHSYGGAVMLQYLLDYPHQVVGGISLGGVSYVDDPPDESFFALPRIPIVGPLATQTVVIPFGRKIAAGIYEQAFWPAEAPTRYVNCLSSLYLRPSQFSANSYELATMYDSVKKISLRYNEILAPVTIIFGDSDQMLDPESDGKRLYKELPNANYILVENAGHKVHHTHPDIVINAIDMLANKIDE